MSANLKHRSSILLEGRNRAAARAMLKAVGYTDVDLAKPIIGSRDGKVQKIPDSPIKDALLRGVTPTPLMEVSSTEIRERLSKKLYCNHLVPGNILDYIRRHNLY